MPPPRSASRRTTPPWRDGHGCSWGSTSGTTTPRSPGHPTTATQASCVGSSPASSSRRPASMNARPTAVPRSRPSWTICSRTQRQQAAVTLRPRLFELVPNVMLRAVTVHGHSGDLGRFQEFVEESFKVVGAPSVGDFFPALRWVDRLRGIDAAHARLQARRDAFVGGLVDDHRRRRSKAGGGHTTSVIDELLALGATRRRSKEGLAMSLLGLTLSALVQCFEWDAREGRAIDMAEGAGLSMPMATPLAVVCRPRELVKGLISAST